MTTKITVKGQVTLPKNVRQKVGLNPHDKVEVRATASGGVCIDHGRVHEDGARRSGESTCGTNIRETITTVTVKGQVTLPKKVREEVGLKPGNRVDVRATASGGIYIEKPGTSQRYRERLEALARERSIRDITTDEFMQASRGEIATPRTDK